jgi:hypothetical protein
LSTFVEAIAYPPGDETSVKLNKPYHVQREGPD